MDLMTIGTVAGGVATVIGTVYTMFKKFKSSLNDTVKEKIEEVRQQEEEKIELNNRINEIEKRLSNAELMLKLLPDTMKEQINKIEPVLTEIKGMVKNVSDKLFEHVKDGK